MPLNFHFQELQQIHKPETLLDLLIMEKKLYEVALKEWTTMEQIGTSFSPQMQKDVSTLLLSLSKQCSPRSDCS